MPRGRPKGSTGSYRWTPQRIAGLFEDADILAGREGGVNKRAMAKRLKQEFPDKYRDTTEGQLREQLSKHHAVRKSPIKLDELDAFNAAVLAHLLGET